MKTDITKMSKFCLVEVQIEFMSQLKGQLIKNPVNNSVLVIFLKKLGIKCTETIVIIDNPKIIKLFPVLR